MRGLNFASLESLAFHSSRRQKHIHASSPFFITFSLITGIMMQARQSRGPFQALCRARRFSTTSATAARSPYRPSTQSQTADKANEALRRDQSTAAATAPRRVGPTAAFNRDHTRYNDVQPLQPYRPQEMDHSFVGMTGGEIFHEMMLRQGVKHVCMFSIRASYKATVLTDYKLVIQVAPFYQCSMRSLAQNISTSSFPGTNKELDIWPRATPEPQASPVSCS